MNTEKFEGHYEASEALALSVAGVTAIILITNLISDLVLSACSNNKAAGRYETDDFCGAAVVASE